MYSPKYGNMEIWKYDNTVRSRTDGRWEGEGKEVFLQTSTLRGPSWYLNKEDKATSLKMCCFVWQEDRGATSGGESLHRRQTCLIEQILGCGNCWLKFMLIYGIFSFDAIDVFFGNFCIILAIKQSSYLILFIIFQINFIIPKYEYFSICYKFDFLVIYALLSKID